MREPDTPLWRPRPCALVVATDASTCQAASIAATGTGTSHRACLHDAGRKANESSTKSINRIVAARFFGTAPGRESVDRGGRNNRLLIDSERGATDPESRKLVGCFLPLA